MTVSIHRLRGCFLGGPLHAEDLPPEIRGPRLELPVNIPGEAPMTFTWLHRRLEVECGEVIESVEFLVLDTLTEAEAEALAAVERERRGGWGEPLLILPAAGFRYETEGQLARDEVGNATGLAGFGLVKRFSPDGVAIAASLHDVSRGLYVEETDPTRCEWCAHGIGHTLDLHRDRLAEDSAERRQARLVGELPAFVPPEPSALALAVIRGLDTDEDALYCAQASEELAITEAHRLFLERRRAELAPANEEPEAPRIVLPAGVRL